ncbi:MAG: branched-chain amino acid ABC transporter permease, partial [Leptolyngbya sp. Prado105]|nr:branched-chain amino acid ABC transporter permease [Leptolyngbya sp. Prado105]
DRGCLAAARRWRLPADPHLMPSGAGSKPAPTQRPAMDTIFGVPTVALYGQLMLGLINGSFYALLSLGLAVIFGMMNVINFTHGAQFMMGAFVAWMLLNWLGLGYWVALLLAPLIVGATGVVIERLMISRLYRLDHLYGLLLTFGFAILIVFNLLLIKEDFGIVGHKFRKLLLKH